jgi:hypothetical protein
MKISKQDYLALHDAIHAVLGQYPLAGNAYRSCGLSDMRFRWDLLHASKFDTSALYAAGLNDTHIDTALRQIIRHANLED